MTLGKLRYWIIVVAVIAVAYFISERNTIFDYALGNTKVSEGQLRRFSKTFQQEYRNIIERRIDPQYRKDFEFYLQRPYKTEIVKSNSKGVALVFVPSTNSEYSCRSTDLEIEATIFPSRTLSEDERSIKMLESVLECVPNQPCFVVSAQNISFVSLEFLTFGSEWIKVVGEGAITTKNIVVDKVHYSNLIKMKASTSRNSWTATNAKREAQELFKWEFSFVFEASEDFREYVAYPELEGIAVEIIENNRENPDYTMLDFDRNMERLYLTGIRKYGVRGPFVQSIYNYLRERHTLRKEFLGIEYTNNWHYTALSSLIIVLLSSFFVSLNLLFRLSQSGRFRSFLRELMGLKKTGDTIFPLVVFWILHGQRPLTATTFQVWLPLVIAIICVGIICYLAGLKAPPTRLQSRNNFTFQDFIFLV